MTKLFSNTFGKSNETITISNDYPVNQFMFNNEEGFGLNRITLNDIQNMNVKRITDSNSEVFIDGGNRGIGIGNFVIVEDERFDKYVNITNVTPILEWLGSTESITMEDAKKNIESFNRG